MNYRVNNLLYAACPGLLNTIRIDISLTEPVDAGALEKAVNTAALRFPYYAVKLARQGETYVMLPNLLPFVVSAEGRTVVLSSESSNYHLFAFACDGCHLFVDTSHFITDGQGLFPFIKTILYYYLSAVHPEEKFDTAGIVLAGSAVPIEEADDYPYPDGPVSAAPLGDLSRPEEIFELPGQPEGYDRMDGWTSFRFRVRQKDLMAFVSGVDGSPATFIASLMYKAIEDIYPENRLPIVCGMQHQFRKALGRPQSHLCHVNIVPIVYPDSLREKSIEQLNTIARGTLIIRADDANDLLTVNEHVRNEKLIRNMDLAQKQAHMLRVIREGIGKNTFEVSYTGKVSWNGMDRYIRDIAPHFDLTLSGGLSIEIFSVGESFCINIMQRSRDPEITDRFAALLSCNGISYTAEEPVHFDLCGFELPR